MKSEVWNVISDDAKDMIDKLLQRSADIRSTAQEAFNHPWITEVRDKENDLVQLNPSMI